MWLQVTQQEGRVGIPAPMLLTHVTWADHVHSVIWLAVVLITETQASHCGLELSIEGGGKRAWKLSPPPTALR